MWAYAKNKLNFLPDDEEKPLKQNPNPALNALWCVRIYKPFPLRAATIWLLFSSFLAVPTYQLLYVHAKKKRLVLLLLAIWSIFSRIIAKNRQVPEISTSEGFKEKQ